MKTIYINTKKELKPRKIKKIAKKLYKINKKEEIVVAFSKDLKEREALAKEIKNIGIKVLNGRWFLKFLISDILEFFANENHEKLEIKSIALLINTPDDIIVEQIKKIAKRVKSLKVVTKDIYRFSYLEEELYLKYGIAIQITSNKNKALTNIDTIVNIDFDEESLKKFNINKFATIINIGKEIQNIGKNFAGKNINNFEINYNKENYLKNEEYFEFDSNILYESYIYRKDTYKNIYKQLQKDDVTIKKLA